MVIGYGDVGKGSAQSLRQEGMIVKVTECDPICAMQACLDGFEVVSTYNDGDVAKGVNTALLANTDMLVTTTGNYNVCDANMLKALKNGAAKTLHLSRLLNLARVKKTSAAQRTPCYLFARYTT